MRRIAPVAMVVAAAVLAPPSSAYPRPGATERVSVSSSEAQGNAPSGYGVYESPVMAMTPDARYVAFASDASNLVPGDTNARRDVFVRDRRAGTTERVSVRSGGLQGTAIGLCVGSDNPAISADGRYVAFSSCFINLVPVDANPAEDVFVHDRVTHETTLVSVGPDGLPFHTAASFPILSGGGRRIVFWHGNQIYLREPEQRRTTLLSVTATGQPADGASGSPSISADGRYVTFVSSASNLLPDQTRPRCLIPCAELYLRDLTKGGLTLVSKADDGTAKGANGSLCCTARRQNFSGDNRYLVFESIAAYVPNGGNRQNSLGDNGQVYVLDRTTGRIERVSVDSTGGGLYANGDATISADGRYVAFTTSVGAAYSCNVEAVAVHDRKTGSTEFLGVGCPGGAFYARPPALSSNGRDLAFATDAGHWVPGDTNKAFDIFVRDRGLDLGVGRIATAVDPAADVGAALTADGANLVGASVVHRPRTRDLFVRLDVADMPAFVLANPAVTYGLDLTVGGARYQVRAAKVGLSASFGLYRQGVRVAGLQGGYGTTGEQVVVAVPLDLVGAGGLDDVRDATAFTTFGALVTDRAWIPLGN